MKVLVVTNLFPNQLETGRGLFNLQQCKALSQYCDLKAIAPMPFYKNLLLPVVGQVEGIETFYPRYFMTPKILRDLYGLFFYWSLRSFVFNLRKKWQFDLILAQWAYPDGLGCQLIARDLQVPCVIMTLGSDINIQIRSFIRRKLITKALNNSSGVISVSDALRERMISIGINGEKIEVIPNGVNKIIFKPMSLSVVREDLLLPQDRKVIFFAGNLVPGKGVELLIEALPHVLRKVLKTILVIAGDGVLKTRMQRRVESLGLQENVRFVGRQSLERIPFYMNASNVFCLPSESEGCPNVILEALSCGVPIVASDIPPIVEALQGSPSARLFPVGNVTALSEAIISTIAEPMPDKEKIRMSILSWQENAKILYDTLIKVTQNKEVV